MVPWEEALSAPETAQRRSFVERTVYRYWRLWTLPPVGVFFVSMIVGILLLTIAAAHPIGSAELLVKQSWPNDRREIEDYVARAGGEGQVAPVQSEAVLALRGDVYLVDLEARGFAPVPKPSADTEEAGAGSPPTRPNCLHETNSYDPACQVFFAKDVGYINALNWSILLSLVFPAVLLFALRVPRLFHVAIERMNAKGMFPDRSLRTRPEGEARGIATVRHKVWRRATAVGLSLFVLSAAVMAADWYSVVYQPTACQWGDAASEPCKSVWTSPERDDFVNELDWSVANTFGGVYAFYYGGDVRPAKIGPSAIPFSPGSPIMLLFEYACGTLSMPLTFDLGECGKLEAARTSGAAGGASSDPIDLQTVDPTANLIFASAAYFVAMVMTGLVLAFYGYLAAVAWTMEEVSAGKFGRVVLPDLRSLDKRFGFHHLWPPIRAVLIATFLGYGILFIVRVQNLFLRAQTYHDIYAYMLEDVLKPLKDIPLVISGILRGDVGNLVAREASSTPETVANILDPGLADTQSFLTVAVFFCVIVVMAILLIFALRDVAERAKMDAIDLLEDPERREDYLAMLGHGVTGTAAIAEARVLSERLQSMETWPLAWPPLRRTVRLLLVGIVFLVFYRAVFIWLGAFIFGMTANILGKRGE